MLTLPDVQQVAADNASKLQKWQARYYNASRREVHYNLGNKVWKQKRVLSSTFQGVAAKLAPKFVSLCTIAAQPGPNVYEVVDQDGKSVSKVHVENLKPFHERTASEKNSEGEQAEASPSEISEQGNASSTSHSANAELQRPRLISVVLKFFCKHQQIVPSYYIP